MGALNLSRRKFLIATGVVGGGLVVGIALTGSGDPPPMQSDKGVFSPNAFLQLTEDGLVRFYCPRDEMGQGVTTGLTTLVAEELDVPPWDIEVVLVGAHRAYANPEFRIQATGGSTSIRCHFQPLRQAGAQVRALLIAAAESDLGLPASSLRTQTAHVIGPQGRWPYGRFVPTAATLELPTDVPLKPRSAFRYIGHEFPRLDGLAKSTGTAAFGIDAEVPGQVYAVVRRCPVAGGSAQGVDKTAAQQMPGVVAIVPVTSGIAVVAERFWQAKKAADAVEITWDTPALATVGSEQIEADYRDALENDPGQSTAGEGDLDAAFESATHVLEQTYWAPFLAHAPMEPMNAVVRIENGEADVWSGTQAPAAAQGLVARYAGLDKDKVRVHGAYLGGGFGRRGVLTHIVEATEAALAVQRPVQVVWTREDDLRHGFLRPASLMRVKGSVNTAGRISGWRAKRVGDNIAPWSLQLMLPGLLPTAVPDGVIDTVAGTAAGVLENWFVDPQSIEGLHGDYDLPNREVTHVTRSHGLPLVYWRAVGHSYTAFAKESFIDELAHESGRDVVDFRLDNTLANPRLRNVIRIAGERMRGAARSPGRGLGLAAHTSFFSYVAQVAEVSVADNTIRVHKMVCVIDCGIAVNPDIVRAQMESSIMYGLTAALHGELTIDSGAVRQSNFHDYPVLRMDEAPEVDVIIVDSDEAPTGVGEPGLPPVAPAVANAVFDATGRRLRALPLRFA